MSFTIYARFEKSSDAERAMSDLVNAGFSADDIEYCAEAERAAMPTVQDAGLNTPDLLPDVVLPLPPTLPGLSIHRPQIRDGATEPGYHYDALGAVIPDRPNASTQQTMPATNPSAIMPTSREHTHRPGLGCGLPAGAGELTVHATSEMQRQEALRILRMRHAAFIEGRNGE